MYKKLRIFINYYFSFFYLLVFSFFNFNYRISLIIQLIRNRTGFCKPCSNPFYKQKKDSEFFNNSNLAKSFSFIKKKVGSKISIVLLQAKESFYKRDPPGSYLIFP